MAYKITFDRSALPALPVYKRVTGMVVPRPIGFVSTLGPSGIPNVAPFSSFNAVSGRPPIVLFSAAVREGKDKDTIATVRAIGEFVVNSDGGHRRADELVRGDLPARDQRVRGERADAGAGHRGEGPGHHARYVQHAVRQFHADPLIELTAESAGIPSPLG